MQAGGTSHGPNQLNPIQEQTVDLGNPALGTKRALIVSIFLMIPKFELVVFCFFFLSKHLSAAEIFRLSNKFNSSHTHVTLKLPFQMLIAQGHSGTDAHMCPLFSTKNHCL